MLKGFILTSDLNSERIPFPQNTSTTSQTPSGPSILMVYYTPWTHLCSELRQSLTTCSSVLARPPPCRSFRSDEDPTSKSVCNTIVWTSSLRQRLLQIVHHFFPCQTCAPQPYGLLKQLPIPEKPWNSISMDFIEKLPPSSSYTSILVIVDCLSKQSLFILTHDTIMSPQLAQLFVLHLFSKHGVPSHVTSDRSTEFISHFFWSLRTVLDMMKLHSLLDIIPEGDGQTERTNQTLEQYL